MGNELSPASGSTSPTGPETTSTPCAVASTAVAVNIDHARRLAVGALMTRDPNAARGTSARTVVPSRWPERIDRAPPTSLIRSAMCARPPSLDRLHVEASSVIADTRGDAPLVAVKLDHHRMSRGMLGNVLQRLHAAEVQGELHVG